MSAQNENGQSMEDLLQEIERLRAQNSSLQQRLLQQEDERDGDAANEAVVVAGNGDPIPLSGSKMERLQPELLIILLEFSGVGLAIKLTICNKTMQQRVLRSAYWVHIDFHECARIWPRPKLTDNDLSNLLKRINACNVTKSLNLRYCLGIHGHGLEPLMHSNVLERINLRRTTADNENMAPAVDVLFSMLYRQLYEVKITSKWGANIVERRVGRNAPDSKALFIQSLRKAKVRQAIEKGTLCHSCKEPLVDKAQQNVPAYLGLPELHCSTCHRKFCRRFTCPANLTECSSCGDSNCQDCITTKQCQECAQWYCTSYLCGSVHACVECNREVCQGCSGIHRCRSCQKFLCEACTDRHNVMNQRIQRCDGCFDDGCFDDGCFEFFCAEDDCKQIQYCVRCDRHLCFSCDSFIDYCVACGFGHCFGDCTVRCEQCDLPCYRCICGEAWHERVDTDEE